MKRALALVPMLGLAALVMAARPGTEQQLVQQLNGQPIRVRMSDGGAWGIFTTYDAGTANNFACAPLTGLTNNVGASVSANVLVFIPLAQLNVCVMPSVNGPMWDGGCNTIPSDINYGWPVAANVPQYITPDSVATRICAVSDAGFIQLPIGWAQ
jgi:hypothetical protein